MPLYHCSNCHHEWEGRPEVCEWCGEESCYILNHVTPLEKLMESVKNSGGWKEYLKRFKK